MESETEVAALDRSWNDNQREFRAAKGLSAAPSKSKLAKELDPNKPLWHRQKREGLSAYEGFMIFLSAGKGRTQQKVAEILGCSYQNVRRWAMTWSWSYRVGAYEEHYMLLRLEDIEAKKDGMWLEQEALALTAMSLVSNQFDSMLAEIKMAREADPDAKIEIMKPDALVRMFDTATKVQRMAVLGRVQNLAETQEREEKLMEQHSAELAELIGAFMNDLELTADQQEKAKEVLTRQLLA